MNSLSGGTQMQRCSFCRRPAGQVDRLVAGPDGVFICEECVDVCRQILDERADKAVQLGDLDADAKLAQGLAKRDDNLLDVTEDENPEYGCSGIVHGIKFEGATNTVVRNNDVTARAGGGDAEPTEE